MLSVIRTNFYVLCPQPTRNNPSETILTIKTVKRSQRLPFSLFEQFLTNSILFSLHTHSAPVVSYLLFLASSRALAYAFSVLFNPCSPFFPSFTFYVLLSPLSSSFPYYDPLSIFVDSSLVPIVSSTPLRRLRYFIIGTIRPLSWIIPQTDKVAEYRRVSLYGSSVSPSWFLHLFSLPLCSSLSTGKVHGFFFMLFHGVFCVRESSFLVPRNSVSIDYYIIVEAEDWKSEPSRLSYWRRRT